MEERTLQGFRILVVEDEYLLADELDIALREAGATVVGPAGSVRNALSFIEGETRIDGAILDVNLGVEMAFSVADKLVERAVPFLFTTGYGALAIPSRLRAIVRCEKPLDLAHVTRAIGALVHANGV